MGKRGQWICNACRVAPVGLRWLFAALIGVSVPVGAASAVQIEDLLPAYRAVATPFQSYQDLDAIVERYKDRRLVLLGEATHGTRAFYVLRALLSRRLIEDGGYSFVAVEGDWVSLMRVNRYVKGLPGAPESGHAALMGIDQWPQWMWANHEFLVFVEWLRAWNDELPPEDRVGVYGIDLYAPWDAMDAVLAYYREHDAEGAETLERTYALFDRYRDDPGRYGRAAGYGIRDAQADVEAALARVEHDLERVDDVHRVEGFYAWQAASVVASAEAFYRKMLDDGPGFWNQRSTHMMETVERLRDFYGENSRGIVWAHNTHVGDARATTMQETGQRNIGQMARERHGLEHVLLLGFATDHGEVIAARAWERRPQTMTIPAARRGSFEAILRELGEKDKLLMFPSVDELGEELLEPLDHRAVGVVFQPAREEGHYVPSVPALRYDALLYIHETSPVNPLHAR